jgi:hypothetical protein
MVPAGGVSIVEAFEWCQSVSDEISRWLGDPDTR